MISSKIQQLDALESLTNRVVAGRSRKEALTGLASVFQSFTQGFAVALSNYIFQRNHPRLYEADLTTKFADSVIEKQQIPPGEDCEYRDIPDSRLDWRQCQKCSAWVHDLNFQDHWERCPYVCGVCYNSFMNHLAFQKHVSICSAPIQTGWTNYKGRKP